MGRQQVFSEIADRLVKKGRRILGISGVDTSGKTEFTRSFARYLQAAGYACTVIHMDDFHNPLAVRRQGSDERDAYYTNAFNYSQLTEEVLIPLSETGRVDKDIVCLNLDTDRYENVRRFTADRDTVVLVEGVLLFRPPIAEYLNGRIWLHIGFDEMLKRARERDVPKYGETILQKYHDKYIPIQKRYLEEHQPDVNCDIFIDNSDYDHPKIWRQISKEDV
jgi:phosphoglycolate phosphatase